jgi:exosortase/archaeosortase family protein
MLAPVAIVGGSLLVSLGIYFGFLGSAWVKVVATWTARWTSSSLNLLGASTTADGTILSSGDFAVNIVAECTPIGPLVLFIGAMAAYPSSARAKGLGVLLGLAALTVVNIFRIMSLFWIGSVFPQYLSIAHLLVWQTAIIVLTIVLWLFWAESVARARHS